MKKIVLLVMLFAAGTTYGQVYLQYDAGSTLKKKGSRSLVMDLHAGYQLNNVLVTRGVTMVEYNQRVLIGGGLNPVYIGGRMGYGYDIEESVLVAMWGGGYYKVVASGIKELNYWIPGYGVSATWKNIAVDISYVDTYHVSIGCRYLLE